MLEFKCHVALVPADSFWTEVGKTEQLICTACQAAGRSIATKCGKHTDRWEERNAFQVYFEDGVVYFVCSTCAQVIDPVKVQI